jgi:hypothetical protein
MMATVPHVTSGLGLRKFQADGFLLTRVYKTVILNLEEDHLEKNGRDVKDNTEEEGLRSNVGMPDYILLAPDRDC